MNFFDNGLSDQQTAMGPQPYNPYADLARLTGRTEDEVRKRAGNYKAVPPANQAGQIPIRLQGGPAEIAMQQSPGAQPAAPPTPGYPTGQPMPGSMFAPGFMSDPNAGEIARKYPQLASYGGKLPELPNTVNMMQQADGSYAPSPEVAKLMQAQGQKREWDYAQQQKYPSLQTLLGQFTPLNASNLMNPYSTQYDPSQVFAGQRAAYDAYAGIQKAQGADTAEQRARDAMVLQHGLDMQRMMLENQRAMGQQGINQFQAETGRMALDPMVQLKSGIAQGYGKQFGEGKTPTAVDARLVGQSINQLRGVLGGMPGAPAAPGVPSSIGLGGPAPGGIGVQPAPQPGAAPGPNAKDPENALMDLVGAETIGKLRGSPQQPTSWYDAWKVLHDKLGDQGIQQNQQLLRSYLVQRAGGEGNIKNQAVAGFGSRLLTGVPDLVTGLLPWGANVYTAEGRAKLAGKANKPFGERAGDLTGKKNYDEKLRQLFGWQP